MQESVIEQVLEISRLWGRMSSSITFEFIKVYLVDCNKFTKMNEISF